MRRITTSITDLVRLTLRLVEIIAQHFVNLGVYILITEVLSS